MQAPTKFEFVVNLKTAKAIYLDVPLHLDQLADELRTGPRADSAHVRKRAGRHRDAAAGFGPILGAIGRQTPAQWRSTALGIATAGGSFGQFAIVPLPLCCKTAWIIGIRLCSCSVSPR